MRHLLFQTEHLANEIVSRIVDSGEDEVVSAPTLTRDIFGVTETSIPKLIKTDEFTSVCEAIDFLIESGKATFDTENGNIALVSG